MKPAQWYHARENNQFGPVSAAELKQLAQAGTLRPDDFVWREGLPSWTPAREIKGLFDDQSPSLAGDTRGVFSMSPIPLPTPTDGNAASMARPLIVESPASADRHFLDFVLEAARRQFTPQFVHSAARLFARTGHIALYGVMLTVVIFFTALGLQAGNVPRASIGLGAALLLVVFQYTAVRFLETFEQFRLPGTGRLGSSALPDCFALLSIAIGVAALVGFTLTAAANGNYWLVLDGLGLFIVAEHAAFVALNPAWLGITIGSTSRPSEEALGLLVFLLTTALCCVPVVFGVEMVSGLFRLLYACGLVFTAPDEEAERQAMTSTFRVLLFAALPCVAYLVFVLGGLVVDSLRGLAELSGRHKHRG